MRTVADNQWRKTLENRPAILVTGPYLADEARQYAEAAGYDVYHTPAYPTAEVLVEHINRHDPVGIVSRMGRFGAEAVAAGRSLKVISKHGAGVDNIDVDAATHHGVQVIRAAGGNAVSVAEHAVALMFATVKRLLPLDAGMRQGRWEKAEFLGRELSGMRLGLVGGGAIAAAVVRIVKGMGLDVAVYDPYASPEAIRSLGAEPIDDIDTLLSRSDIVSLHCPLTEANAHLLDARTLALMPKDSYVINTSRGGLIDEKALLAALENGHIAGAGLDTFEREPPEGVNPLAGSERVILTPHIAGVTEEAGTRVGVLAVSGIVDFLSGTALPPARMVNSISETTCS
ncbi:hydroxyacid dehydrogenase [Kushneria konosiri]|uniref:Hydroxyacid dehydrogenase n=2 Tax=Kushneria TaxID=504090 RepID=A0A240UK55_9GAMM|nr:hydroxyacid dehydrogenase [Kushneria konosiri]ART61887.1 hydroxyacid dehydrogenase [Kushneria marisflavi]RKD86933.1 D-3-phosphoglycerate dehydrogenase [Kushneria marisflavi]